MEDAFALVVLTLLQLCRGEITQPEWFAANLINDSSYTPKPITEIFTSDLTFTSKNPALFTQPTTLTTSTPPPITRTSTATTTLFQLNDNSLAKQIQTQRPPSHIAGIQRIPEVMSQVVENAPQTETPNFLIIYDPRRQTNPNLRSSVMLSSPPTTSQSMPTVTESTPAIETTESTTFIPSNQRPIASLQPGDSQPIPNTPFWPLGSILAYPIQIQNLNPVVNPTIAPTTTMATSTAAPQHPKLLNAEPVLTVRVKSPKGSITKILINPTTTTKRPPRSTTRRRKSNRRSNNYEACVNSCHGKKTPICSSPTGIHPINPDKLKGFASLCHMACHNSFKKEQVYEKVTDGRCGRLRTRIRPVDKNKLDREELNKAQYTIVHNAPGTVVEFSPLRQ